MSRLPVLMTMLLLMLPASAAAATSASFDDPVGDSPEYAADLGLTTVTVGDDDTIAVDTRIVPRPPAYWGGCAYYVGSPPFQTCAPANMNVTWYLDWAAGAGSLADQGADAKVTVVPSKGQAFWEGARWDTAAGKFAAGAQPAGSEDPGGAHWALRLADLGIPRPATVRLWAVSTYKSYNGLGQLFDHTDTAGPGSLSIAGPLAAATPTRQSRPCRRALARTNRVQRRIRAARKQLEEGARGAGKKLRRLKKQRRGLLASMQAKCAAPIAAPEPAPAAAPPGCHLVTKPVLRQEGTGIYAAWVVKPEVVVECGA